MPRELNNVLRIGLTGGIASGKSLVADCFAGFGVPVIDTDEIAREIVEPGQPALQEIRRVFGDNLVGPEGALDRRRMRQLIFADESRRADLEAILHPRIRQATQARADRAGGPYQVLVVPLLVETGFGDLTDRVLVVDCPVELQTARLLSRDAEDPAQVERILAAQISRTERLAAADDVIDNSGTVAATRAQAEALHKNTCRSRLRTDLPRMSRYRYAPTAFRWARSNQGENRDCDRRPGGAE